VRCQQDVKIRDDEEISHRIADLVIVIDDEHGMSDAFARVAHWRACFIWLMKPAATNARWRRVRPAIDPEKIVSETPDGVLTIDEQHHIGFANQAAERIFGYGSGHMSGLAWEALLPSSPSATELAGHSGETLRLEGRHFDGHSLDLEVSLCAHA